MIYRSNLTAPDLMPHFKHMVSSPMPQSFGHDVPRDWSDKPDDDPFWATWKQNGSMTHDEVAILHEVASRTGLQASWIDVGSHTGWTSKHLNYATNSKVFCVEPMLQRGDFRTRFCENTRFPGAWQYARYSNQFFHYIFGNIEDVQGVCIDGDHTSPAPLEDAVNAATVLAQNGVIVFHDALGLPVREAALWLMNQGFKARWYETPHGMIVCWRGDFVPPDHVSDPNLPDLRARCPEFPFERCS